jgi:putative inorganic carbon (HCO3(-)) transporter
LIGSAIAWANRTGHWGAIPALCLAGAVALAIALLPLSGAVLLVAGGIVLVAILLRPQAGVLLLVPAVPFGTLRQITLGVIAGRVGLTEALVFLVLAAWLMRMVARRGIRIALPRLALPLTIFLGTLFLSLPGATSLQHSIKEILKWVEVMALYLLVANEMDARWTRALVFTLLGTGALTALHGIYQFLFQVGPEGFVLFDRFMRAHGTFEQPNPYGGYLGLTLPLAVGLAVAGALRVGGRIRGWWLIWVVGCGALMLAALVMSWSRGAWLGFGAALAVMAIAVVVRRGRAAVLGTVFAVLAAYLLLAGGLARVPPSVVQRFSDFVPYLGVLEVEGREITDANFAVLERVAHWQSAWKMWTDRPWLGVGIGNYEPAYPRYALPLWPLPLGHAHNYYLNIAAEVGVLGLGAYLVLWGAALVGAWQDARRASGWQWGVALGVVGVLVHLSTHNFFDNLYVHGMYLHVAILLGIGTAVRKD